MRGSRHAIRHNLWGHKHMATLIIKYKNGKTRRVQDSDKAKLEREAASAKRDPEVASASVS